MKAMILWRSAFPLRGDLRFSAPTVYVFSLETSLLIFPFLIAYTCNEKNNLNMRDPTKNSNSVLSVFEICNCSHNSKESELFVSWQDVNKGFNFALVWTNNIRSQTYLHVIWGKYVSLCFIIIHSISIWKIKKKAQSISFSLFATPPPHSMSYTCMIMYYIS